MCRGFKALKQIVKLLYKLEDYSDMMSSYRWVISHLEYAINANSAELCSRYYCTRMQQGLVQNA